MRTNNFDQSSSGLNLELTCFRDTDISRCDFEESFTRVNDDLWIYTEFGNVSDDFSLSDPANYKFTVKELKQAVKNNYDTELSQHYMGKSFSRLTKAELFEFLDCLVYDQSELAEFLQDNFDPLFDTITTRGYCQGDRAEVIITPAFKQYLVNNGTTFESSKNSLQTTIDHLFWDAPIYCRLDVDDKEYFLDEYLTDLYEYDKDKLIHQFKVVQTDLHNKTDCKNFDSLDQLAIVLEFLSDNLPEYPDYK